ncbi:hypothetical protein IOQ59_10985 [Pontibacterium sp. N1Y112]|uniref:Uncharacterized protein n=1 Tax=Pontibacterium sinense TaxID=2781979 RepID=A0A8J7K734_9GAMM|nr:hypothetical protein [Pontibacterium sinense]MBE9397781.1 hypothetical protein [Pontibacterium sinense]
MEGSDKWALLICQKHQNRKIVLKKELQKFLDIHKLHNESLLFFQNRVTTINPKGYLAQDVKDFFEQNGFQCNIYGLK